MDKKYLAQLTTEEGCRMTVYDDATGQAIVPGTVVKGHPTIGIGRALDVHGINAAECDYLFSNDVYDIETRLSKAFPWYGGLSEGRRYVLVAVAFNCGWAGLVAFKRMLAALQNGAWNEAALQLLDSGAARQLPARYNRMAATLRSGQ